VPELPEVETIVRQLARALPGAVIRRVEVLKPDLIDGEPADTFAQALEGRRIESVARRAKNIVVDTGGEYLLVNLGMTGRLFIVREEDASVTHPGVRFGLADGRELLYHDVRRFGRLWRMSPEAWRAWEGELGVEPLSDDFTAKWLYDAARRSRVAVKVWLMDQKRVVGVGNIYASEALFRARIRPRRQARSLTRQECARLARAIKATLAMAVKVGGTTLRDYVGADGNPGYFRQKLYVYERAGKPCRVCGRSVKQFTQGQRSTYWCSYCQK
jgi:formamidopyrimidine-DNA glycosylase